MNKNQEFSYPREHIEKQKQVIKSLTDKLDDCLKQKVRLQKQLKEYKKDVSDWKLHYDGLKQQLEKEREKVEYYKKILYAPDCPEETQNQSKDEF